MDRAGVAGLVGSDLSAVLAAAGMAATDSAGALKEPIDRALRSMGYGEAALAGAAPADGALFEAQAQYETLRTVLRRLGDQTNLGLGTTSLSLNQLFANVKALLAEAEDRVRSLGGAPGGSGVGTGALDLGWQTAGAGPEWG